MTFQIRHAVPGDAHDLAEVHVVSWKAAYAGLLPSAYLDSLAASQRTARWEKRFLEPQTMILVSEEQGEICGFCFGGSSRDSDADPDLCGEIQAIYLLPDKWGMGAGHLLCIAAMDELRRSGYTEVTLWVLRQNQRARSFYERMGFELDGATKVKTKEAGVQLDEVRYRRSLC